VIVDLASDFEDVCSRSGWLSISMTISVLEALRQLGGSGMGIRWPNDVVDQRLGRKLCGCLAEVNDAPLSTPGLGRAIVSFGLNVGHRQSEDFADDVRSSAVSLAMLASEQDWDCPLDRSDILVQILHRFNGLVINPPKDWGPYWERYSVLDGQMIQVRSGGREWQGQAIGLEKDGSLVMRLSAGRLKNFQSGDVDFLRPIQAEEA
jgi:BirA family biotin operon repressor/biotin-[acetyl-CoA-carboxylase] ligase